MRVAMVSSTLPPEGHGGAEAYVAALAGSLAPRHEVLVLSGAAGIEVEGVGHVQLPHQPPVRHDASPAGRAWWHLRDQWMPSVHAATVRALRDFGPDVVHTHEPQGLSAAVFTGVARTRAPHVHTAHDLNLICLRTSMTRDGEPCGGGCVDCRLQRLVRGTAFKRHIDALLAVSDFIRDRHVEAGVVPADRARTLWLAAEPGRAAVRSAGPGGLRLGFIGTLEPHKGIRTLIGAMAGAPEDWSLRVAGTGRLADEVAAAAARDGRIAYAGRVDGEAKEAFFDAIDILVIPSEWEEPGATVCFEAAVRGVPSVVSDRGGLPELPEVTVFAAGDAAGLRAAVADLAGRLEPASRRLLDRQEEFTWSRHVARVEEVMEAAIRA